MSIPFKKPVPGHRFIIDDEIDSLKRHFQKRNVPDKTAGRLLMASWNIANLGAQGRTSGALQIIADIMKHFELIAVQEVNEEFRTFAKIVKLMGREYDYVMCDTAGNNERLAFVFDKGKVQLLQLFGELALRKHEFPKRTVRVRYRKGGQDRVEIYKNLRFVPFDRNPFIGSFKSGKISFMLVNCHLYFGKFQNSTQKWQRERYARRVLEIFALSKWAARRVNRKASYDRDIILLGDMNVPAMSKNESTYQALIQFGFKPVNYTSKVGGSNLGNDKTYDQMTFAPGTIERRIKSFDVFDFDKAIFLTLWKKLIEGTTKGKAIRIFRSHVRYHISDHRPLWVQLDIT